jgi:uncharacterized protein YdcH (DUF465 family)
MKAIDHLNIQHRMLDDQIDEMERKLLLPDSSSEVLVQTLKKERLRIRDVINQHITEDDRGKLDGNA